MCVVRNGKLVIDWHNFGYTILALKLGPRHPLVWISEKYEKLFGRFAHQHFAVTNAMSRILEKSFHVSALPLHDRPAAIFQPLSRKQRSAVLSKLSETATHSKDLQSGNSKLIVSSTSWTPDEDFSLLLDALVGYSEQAAKKSHLPDIVAIITGKGPEKELYLKRIRKLNEDKKLQRVTILTAWLSAEDYASLLGAADIGISLHKSSSGVDLPMKVVDMFGTGLPVLGWSQFEAWPELVREDFNGRGFKSAEQLQLQLEELMGDDGSNLKRLREGALKECAHRWDDEWDLVAGRLFKLVTS
jgi:beta-1,4-mannosyltransferase